MQCPGVAPPPDQIWRGEPSFDRARRHATCDERCAVQDRQLRPATSGTVSAKTWCAPCRVQRFHTPIHHRAACLFVCAVRSDSAQSPCSAWFPIVCSHATLSGRQKQRPECSELHEAVPQAQVDKAGHVHAADVSRRNHKMMELYLDQDLPILHRWSYYEKSRVLFEKCRPDGRGRSRLHR